ncbi:MAG: poly(R)-hydroxyalkanoic acid synthase subunit PhaE [Micavibrio sp.]|nr:poly(R)-hydroxyalkanoic acid synthase subunit PhaE [Micavibrio sp.]
MSAPNSFAGPFGGTTDWQQYWDSWFQSQRAFFDAQHKNKPADEKDDSLQGQWAEFFKAWQGNLTPTLPGAASYQQHFQKAGQQFIDMLQHFYAQTGQNKPVGDVTGDWLKTMQNYFLTMLQANTQPVNPMESMKAAADAFMKTNGAWASAFQSAGNPFGGFNPQAAFGGFGPQPFGFAGFGQQGFQQGFGAFGGFAPPPNFGTGFGQSFGQGFNWGQPQQQWNPQAFQNFDPFGFYASIPGIGYTREKQDELNHLYQRWVEFDGQTRKYNAAMAQVGLEALHKFQEYIANPPKDAESLKSLKEVYAKWVDVCEDVYAKYAMSDEYTKLYGEVVNALMQFKAQMNHITDEMAGQMNLPTRKEVDSLHQRVHALRRDNIALRKAVDELRGIKRPATANATAPAKPAKKGGKK